MATRIREKRLHRYEVIPSPNTNSSSMWSMQWLERVELNRWLNVTVRAKKLIRLQKKIYKKIWRATESIHPADVSVVHFNKIFTYQHETIFFRWTVQPICSRNVIFNYDSFYCQ